MTVAEVAERAPVVTGAVFVPARDGHVFPSAVAVGYCIALLVTSVILDLLRPSRHLNHWPFLKLLVPISDISDWD
jgi:hypothetical protein